LAGGVFAQDTVRLGGPTAQASMTGAVDELVRGYHGGGYRGGYHGGGYRGGYHGGHYHGGYGYRGGYYGGGYGYRYASYYRPYYGYGYGYAYPRYYGSYYPYVNYYTPAYYAPTDCYYSATYYPIAGETVQPAVVTVPGNGSNYRPQQPVYQQPAYQQPANQQPRPNTPMMPPPGDGTFRYDGDPKNIVPMPAPQDANPSRTPLLPVDGKLVSLPARASGGVNAFGPQSLPTSLPTSAATTTPRPTYAAYGEEPIAPAPRKTK